MRGGPPVSRQFIKYILQNTDCKCANWVKPSSLGACLRASRRGDDAMVESGDGERSLLELRALSVRCWVDPCVKDNLRTA